MSLNSRPTEEEHKSVRAASLPWWTWVAPFFIANLGTWLSLWFKTDPGASLWYLPTAFGIVMVYWWGPRVLLGIYLNAVVCAPLWDLPWKWSFLYALPETIEVGLSWLLFIKIMRGKCWLPNLRQVATFLLFGSFAPTFLANIYLVFQLYLLGDIASGAIWENWRVVFSADLATQFVLAVPVLVLFTKSLREKGWTQTTDAIVQLPLLPENRNSLRDIIFIIGILGTALIAILTFSIHDPWILYGFLMILIAIRYGVSMAVIGTSWIGILAFLLPVILTGKLGLSTATYGDFVTTNFDILFLCGVTLLTGRTISDLFMQIAERKRAEEQVSLLQTITLEVAAARDLSSGLQVVLRRVCEKTGWVYGQAWVPRRDKSVLDCDAAWFSDPSLEKFRTISMGLSFPPGRGLPGRVVLSKQPVWLEDATLDPNFPRAASAVESGLKAALAVPILAGGEILAVIEFFLRDPRTEDERLVKVIAAVAAQLGLVLERKRVEGLLGERQHLLQKILDTEPGTVYIYDLAERRNIYVNHYWLRAFGYTEEETQAMGDEFLTQILHPDDLGRISAHHENWRQADEGDIREIEYRVRSKAEKWYWLHSHEAAFARDELGKVTQILGISYDITPRKLAQEALRKSERILREAEFLGHTSSWEQDLATGEIFNSEGNLHLFFGNDPGKGGSLEDYVQATHPDDREFVVSRRVQLLEGGPGDIEYRVVWPDGSVHVIFGRATIVRDESGKPIRVYGTNVDITERKQAQEELAKRAAQLQALAGHLETVREDERTRIAREIHDEFGQFLTALKMDLAWVSRRLEVGDEKRERLNRASSLVDENVRLVQRITTELRPGLLDDLGLVTALDWQAHEFSKHTGLLCQLNFPEHDLKLDPSLNTTLFRIFQETLTNVARHAQASRVDVSLQEKDQTLLLSVHDNGRGITESELNDPKSLGLLGLRERVAQWKGDLSIRGEAGKGTTVTVQIPISVSASDASGGSS